MQRSEIAGGRAVIDSLFVTSTKLVLLFVEAVLLISYKIPQAAKLLANVSK